MTMDEIQFELEDVDTVGRQITQLYQPYSDLPVRIIRKPFFVTVSFAHRPFAVYGSGEWTVFTGNSEKTLSPHAFAKAFTTLLESKSIQKNNPKLFKAK